MDGSIAQIAFLLLVGGLLGAGAGLWLGARMSKRRIGDLSTATRSRLAELTHQKTQIATELAALRSKNKSLRGAVAQGREKLKSTRQKSKILVRNILTLRDERESTKIKINTLHKSLEAVKRQTVELQREFERAGDFYKRELRKSFEKRTAAEQELREARAEQEAFTKRIETSVLEHGSPEEMITAAQLRLGQLEVLERNVNKLEAENKQLRDEATRKKRDFEALQSDLAELNELRINNQQLVRAVESLENSRQQQEQEAEKYRGQAEQSEQLSETLRLKLDDLQKNFADIEQQQQQAISDVRNTTMEPANSDGNDTDVVDLAQYSNRR